MAILERFDRPTSGSSALLGVGLLSSGTCNLMAYDVRSSVRAAKSLRDRVWTRIFCSLVVGCLASREALFQMWPQYSLIRFLGCKLFYFPSLPSAE